MLQLDIHGPIAHVTLDRPDAHNAFNEEFIARIAETFRDLSARTEVRAVILRGHGKSFCAGADLHWMQRVSKYNFEENVNDARAAAEMFLTLTRCPKPVIARVHGAAIGGGSGLIAACDMAAAVRSAQFGFTEVKLGILPAIIAPFALARIGQTRARQYFLTGERFTAATALDIGLIQHVAPDEAGMDEWIDARIAEILTASPAAVAAAKDLIFRVSGYPSESVFEMTTEAIAKARASADGQAGFAAFLNRTKPPWAP